jgi:uncharacterized membrane protein
MIKIDGSITINRPVEEVFNFTITNENDAQWQGGVISSESVLPKEGASFTQVLQFLGRQLEVPLSITKMIPNQSYRVRSMGEPFPVEIEFLYEAVPEGTQMKVVLDGEPGGFFKLAEPLVARITQRQWETNLENLKDLLESQN